MDHLPRKKHTVESQPFKFEISNFQDIMIIDLFGTVERSSLDKLEAIFNMLLDQKKSLILLNFKNVLNVSKNNLDILIDYNKSFEKIGGSIVICGFKPHIFDGKIPELNEKYLFMISKKINFFDNESEAIDYFNNDLSTSQDQMLTPDLLNVNKTVYLSTKENTKGLPFAVISYSYQHITLQPLSNYPAEYDKKMKLFLRYLSPRGVHSVLVKKQEPQTVSNKGKILINIFFPGTSSVNINRKHKRYNIRIMADYSTYQELIDNPASPKREGVTRNISSDGTLLEVNTEIAPGTLLALSFRLGKAQVRLCLGEVVRVFHLKNMTPPLNNTPRPGLNNKQPPKKYALGIKFKAIFPEDRESIFNHIMTLTSGNKTKHI